jgi:hypothetical protein
MPIIKSLGITFRYTINGASHEKKHTILGEEDLLWILLYADDIALMSDDPDKLRDMVTALDSAFQRCGLLICVGKTKTLTVYIPRQGEGPVAVPVICIGTQRIEHVKQFKYLGQIIASDWTVKGEVTRRLGLAYAAFNRLGKQGIWKDKKLSTRTKLTIYKATVLTILLYCAETWSIGPEDVRKLETAQMSCLRRICGDRSWGPDSTPCAEIRRHCEMPSIGTLISCHRLRWLGKVCRMTDDRLPLRTLSARVGGRAPRGCPPITWIGSVREDLVHLSELHGVFGTYMNCWLQCKDRKSWTIAIHKLKQTNNRCRTGAVRAAVH